MFARIVWLVLRKDFTVEVRSLEIAYTTLFFAMSSVLVFSFAFVREGQPVENAAAGILWVAIAFSGTLALGRTFERERQAETLRALLLSPAERPAVYLGKLAGVLVLLVAVELVVTPLILAVPAAATAPALIIVGVLMLQSVAEIDMRDFTIAAPAALTLVGIPLLFSIADGIGLGFIASAILATAVGRPRVLTVTGYVIAVIFFLQFFKVFPFGA